MRMAQQMMPYSNGGHDRGSLVPGITGAPQSAIDGGDRLDGIESGMDMELWREANLEVADPFGLVVLGQLGCGPFERFCRLQRRDGVLEPAEVLAQARVAFLEHRLPQPAFGRAGQLHAAFAGQFDQGRQPQGAVEVDVEIGLRQGGHEGGRDG
jgi:hypothetical protein